MEDVFQPKALVLYGIFSIIIVVCVTSLTYFLRSAKVVFCDVGQGDAIYIRTYEGSDVLFDAGSSRDVLDCLGQAMPVYDRTLELAVVTHPHIDHYGGFVDVYERYTIEMLVINPSDSKAKTFARLLETAQEMSQITYVERGDSIIFGPQERIDILWPVHATDSPDDVNELSIIALYTVGASNVLLTGDATPRVLAELLQSESLPQRVDILKAPHHGSKNGLTQEFLDAVMPSFTVISVGKKNRYNHLSESVMNMLEQSEKDYALTYEKGTITLHLHPDEPFSR